MYVREILHCEYSKYIEKLENFRASFETNKLKGKFLYRSLTHLEKGAYSRSNHP
jgi:hypothetical protein